MTEMTLEEQIKAALFPEAESVVRKAPQIPPKIVTVVTLLVRDTIHYPHSIITYEANTLSRDLAIIEAEKVARALGKSFIMLVDVELVEVERHAKGSERPA